jgi:MFS family permease
LNLAALHSPDFRFYLLGNIFALNAVWLSRITLGWLAWSLTGQAAFVGLIAFLSFAPTLISGPFFGVLADRVDLRRAALATQSGLALAAAALLGAHLAGALGPGLLAGIAAAIGVVTSAHHPVRMALAPALVERSAIASVVALTSVNFNLARLLGPALGGIIIARFGIGAALAATAAGFLPLIGVLLRLESPPRIDAGPREAFLAALAAGIRHAAGVPLIRGALLLTFLFSLAGRGVLEILPVVADGAFGRGPAGLGALTAAAGFGALIASASLALGRSQTPGRLPRRAVAAALLGLGMVAGLGRTGAWPLALALVAGLGATGTLVGISMQSAVQLVVPDALRGRVMSLWTLVAVGGAALGALGLGALIDLAGARAALSATGLAGLAAMLLLVARPLAAAAAPTPPLPETAPAGAPESRTAAE